MGDARQQQGNVRSLRYTYPLRALFLRGLFHRCPPILGFFCEPDVRRVNRKCRIDKPQDGALSGSPRERRARSETASAMKIQALTEMILEKIEARLKDHSFWLGLGFARKKTVPLECVLSLRRVTLQGGISCLRLLDD